MSGEREPLLGGIARILNSRVMFRTGALFGELDRAVFSSSSSLVCVKWGADCENGMRLGD